ncbi:hypothetical protein [Amycolatopsis cihanbeyliensis]|uniref:hypothetical protein n=1 Tax=Amycolatopsis cihanbeyliensis TaxID=1128664 RepID=UPI001154D6E8|nr:hypothetical protein [Amycolatopsis cihanbeyliensis]
MNDDFNEVGKGMTAARSLGQAKGEPPRLSWRAHVHANNEQSAYRTLNRLSDLLNEEVEVQSVKRNEKFRESFVLSFWTQVPDAAVDAVVLHILLVCQRVASGWTVTGPIIHDAESWEFDLVCPEGLGRHFRVSGVFWISVSFRMYPN